MTKSALIIDLDGTLYDTPEINLENKHAAVSAISEFRDMPIYEAKKLFEANMMDANTSTASILQSMLIPDRIFEKYQLALVHPENHIKPDPELVALLRSQKNKYKLVLLTNTRRQIALKALDALQFKENDFDLILCGGDIPEAKPSIKNLRLALTSVKCDPKSSYTIGDRWNVDHVPGQALGMSAIQVNGRGDFVRWLKTLSPSEQS